MVTRPHALRRILTNLIDNALKFGGSAEVSRPEEMPSEPITIRVLDRGPGIPEEQLEAVLQPFFRLEQSRNRGTGGTGLGLAIAQQLTLAIDGTLNLANRPDGGLSAEITLPQKPFKLIAIDGPLICISMYRPCFLTQFVSIPANPDTCGIRL